MGRKFQKVAFKIVKCSFCYTILRNTLNNLGFLISLSDGISGLDRKEDKSFLDIRLSVGVCKEFYQNQIDSFILASSDSDYGA